MLKKTMGIFLALALMLGLCSCALSQAIEGVTAGGSDDPNLGLWKATTGEMMGMSMDVTDVFGEGFTIELKSGGKCTLMVDGDKAGGKWTLDEAGAFTVKGGGVDAEGTLKDGKLVLEDVLGMGMTLTFEKEGGSPVESPGSAAASDTDYFVLTSITESGETVSGADLAALGLDGFYILLHKDGKAEVMLDPLVTGTWKDGEIDLGDMGLLTYAIKGDELTTEIDGTALIYTRSKETPPASGASGGTEASADPVSGSTTALQEWWNGHWYGYWEVTDAGDLWSELDGGRWDCYAEIDIDADGNGTIHVWDDEIQIALGIVEVSEDSGAGAMGAAISTGGTFGDDPLERADWIIDPNLYDYDDYMVIDGHYEDPEDPSAFGGFSYIVVLRPWGIEWSDIPYDEQPPNYYTWYLENYTKPMPVPGLQSDGGESSGGASSGGGGGAAEMRITDDSGKEGTITAACPDGWYDHSAPEYELRFSSSSDAWDTDAPFISVSYSAYGVTPFWNSGTPLSYSFGALKWEGFHNTDANMLELTTEVDDGGISIVGGNIDPESTEFQQILSSVQVAWNG